MKKAILFALPGNEEMGKLLCKNSGAAYGELSFRHFPDGESYVRIVSDVKDRTVVLVCTLNFPDDKFLPLYFLALTAKTLGAKEVFLVAPYLAYMRQDKIFHPGEALTSTYFAKLISSCADALFTIDPHLHRIHNLGEIYDIPTKVFHAADAISKWIIANIQNPLIVGPDEESEQWVAAVAKKINCPYIVLKKERKGDRQVEVSVPEVANKKQYTPVLLDDIISTARTMIATVGHLITAGMQPPVCIGVHAIFAGNAYAQLKASGAGQIITANTIKHETNAIDLSEIITLF